MNSVIQIPPAPSDAASQHFSSKLSLETDCSDVYEALQGGSPGFVILDVRGPKSFAKEHVPQALNVHHTQLTKERLARWPLETLFVVYCAGPHCNGADKGALALSRLGRPVKIMIGGMTGWHDEGFATAVDAVE